MCPACRAESPEGARFCPSCGQDLRLRGDERRVATVLFADLVGFTALSEARDPEQVKLLVDRCFERLVVDIEAFGGRVDKIIGDAIVALFGAPVAHEDDAERAVRAALRMQETLSAAATDNRVEVRIRVGVNTGEVLVGALRAGGDYTAMGDVVNTANRLQAAAEPGQVVVGPATYAATRRVVRYRALGPVPVRGREEPVPAWIAEAALAPPGYRPDRGRAGLVGRDAEFGLFRHAIGSAFANQRAALLLVSGEAGVGKSRLAEELSAVAAADHNALVLEGRCVPYGEANVWWPVADALRHGCGIRSSDPDSVARELALVSVRTALGEGAPDAEVTRVHTGLLHMLGLDTPLRALDASRAREEATAAVVTLVERFTLRRPVLVVLSDLHWADDPVLDLVDTLLERLTDRRFAFVATARRSLDDRWQPRHGRHNLVRLTLDPLGADAAAELLGELAADVPADLAAELLDRAGGNPFFLEELVALLGEAGVLAAGDGDRAMPIAPALGAAFELPDTLRGLLAARLDGLGAEERAVLDDCAVLGRRGPMRAIEVLAAKHLAIDDVRPVLESLVAKELLVLTGEGESEKWGFRSDLVREVAYGTLTKAVRATTHAGIATWMEANEPLDRDAVIDRITHHFVRAAELVAELGPIDAVPHDLDRRAIAWVDRAARRAADAELVLVAARLHETGLGLLDRTGTGDDAQRRTFLLGRAHALAQLRDLGAARADVTEALAAARADDASVEVARALLVLADVEQKDAEWERSEELLAEAEGIFAGLGDSSGEAEALRVRGFGALFRHDYDRAEELLDRALGRFDDAGDRRGRAWALQNLGWVAFYSGRIDVAERRLQTAAETFEDLGDVGGQLWVQGLLAWTRFFQGHTAEAEAMAEPLLEALHGRGDRWAHGMMQVLTASIRLWTGRAASAVDRAGSALELFEAIDDDFGRLQAQVVLARALVSSGRVAEGVATLDAMHGLLRARTAERDKFYFLATAVGVGVQLGDIARTSEAIDHVPRLGEDASLVGEGEMLVLLARHRFQRGDAAGAVARLEAVAHDGPDRLTPSLAAALALTLPAVGRADDGVEVAERVLADPMASYLDRIDAMVAKGAALVRAGCSDEGLATLTAAREAADATDDRVAAAVVRVAQASAATTVCTESAPALEAEAAAALGAIGIEGEGWRTALALALGSEPALL